MKACAIILISIIFISSVQGKEVPHPGEEGKKTLLGIDSDKDGIRDDVQIWINQKYPISSKPNTNQALKQAARNYSLVLEFHEDEEKTIKLEVKTLEAINCIGWISDRGIDQFRELRGKIIDTPERIRAFIKSDSHMHGASRPEHIINTKSEDRFKFCEFEVRKE